MAKKKTKSTTDINYKENQAPPTVQPITETLRENYMPYAMSVIISRAIPEIDGLKPSHRKVLYTMYKMGLLTGGRTKSANIVGQTMHLNPHGDSSIYETMVRLTRANETLLHPLVDSKGSFGKVYSADPPAAARYTEAKLDPICHEFFSAIDKDAVDFVPNYDNTTKEPVLLPTTFPHILVIPTDGLAVGMSSHIPSFNLNEVCDGTIAVLKNPATSLDRLMDIIQAPDYSTGGQILYNREEMRSFYESGDGGFRLRGKYVYHKETHSIDFVEIPYITTIEKIIEKAVEMIKSGKLREVTDVRDAIDLSGFRLTFDLRRDADPEVVIKKLFASTQLECKANYNLNILIDGRPKLLGVKEIIEEWIRFRIHCLSRELRFDLKKKGDKLELLNGLAAILLDIDKAIRIIRSTEREEDVVPNLQQGFSINERQAEYIADIKLRNLNRQYILNRLNEIESLRASIDELTGILRDELKIKALIISQLQEVKKKYGQPRKTEIIYDMPEEHVSKEELFFEDYHCHLLLTHDGYFKKLSVQSARATDEHKLKEGDYIIWEADTDNRGEMLFFTDKGQMYRVRVCEFDLCKGTHLGVYIPTELSMDDGEHVVGCALVYDIVPEDHMVFIFENGKGVRIPMSAYASKTRRKKTSGAISVASVPVGAFYEPAKKPLQIFIRSSKGKGMLIKSGMIVEKATRTAGGTALMTLPKNAIVDFVTDRVEELGEGAQKCRKIAIPSTGSAVGALKIKFP